MLQEHSTKSKNVVFESSIKINFGSGYLITHFFFEGGTKTFQNICKSLSLN